MTETGILKRARRLKKREAKELLKGWLAANGRSARVLSALAEVCMDQQDYDEAFSYARESYLLNRKDPRSLTVFLRILWATDNLLTALAVCEELPRKVMHRHPVQVIMDLTYFRLGCWVRAKEVRRNGNLKPRGVKEKLASVAVVVLRPLLRRREVARVGAYLYWSRGLRATVLSCSPVDEWADALTEVDKYIRGLVGLWEADSFRRRLSGYIVPLLGLLLFVPVGDSADWRLDSVSGYLLPITGSAGMLSVYFGCHLLWSVGNRFSANIFRVSPVVVSGLALCLLIRERWLASDVAFWLYVGLGAGLLSVAAGITLGYALNAWYAFKISQLRKSSPRAAVLDIFIDLKDEISKPRREVGYNQRKFWVEDLEKASRLLPAYLLDGLGSVSGRNGFKQRADGANAKLHQMKLMIMSPGKDTWTTLDRLVAQYMRAIALGRWGNLPYADPPPTQAPLTRRQKVASSLKGMAIALLPIGALLFVDVFIDSSPQMLDWFKVLAAIWAVVTILFALDPNFREKIQAVTELANSARDAGSGPSEQRNSRQKEVV